MPMIEQKYQMVTAFFEEEEISFGSKEDFAEAIAVGFFRIQVPETLADNLGAGREFAQTFASLEKYKLVDKIDIANGYLRSEINQTVRFTLEEANWTKSHVAGKEVEGGEANYPARIQALGLEMKSIGIKVLKGLLRKFGMPESLWRQATAGAVDGDGSNHLLFNCYDSSDPVLASKPGLRPHKDFGHVTVVDRIESGLEVYINGAYRELLIEKEFFIINIGEALHKLIPSINASLHRVVTVRQGMQTTTALFVDPRIGAYKTPIKLASSTAASATEDLLDEEQQGYVYEWDSVAQTLINGEPTVTYFTRLSEQLYEPQQTDSAVSPEEELEQQTMKKSITAMIEMSKRAVSPIYRAGSAKSSPREVLPGDLEISDLQNFLRQLPKAELHVHLDGTLEPELMFQMAERNAIPFPYENLTELQNAYHKIKNLDDFLALYFLGASVIRTEQDFFELTNAYLTTAHQQGVRHTEMFVGPQTHTWKENVTIDTILDGTIKAIKTAEKNLDMTARIIIDFNRCYVKDQTLIGKQPTWSEHAAQEAPEDARKTYNFVQDYLTRHPADKKYVVAFGLDYSEKEFPPIWFKELFTQIIQDGYKTVAHAGEEGPAAYVKQALVDLGVSRIDHGNHAIDDDSVMQEIIDRGIPLDMCPLSNIVLGVEQDLQHHPIKEMLRRGVKVNVGSDDPPYTRGYILQNLIAIVKALRLSYQDCFQLAKNSMEASFLEVDEKRKLIGILDAFQAEFTATQSQDVSSSADNICSCPRAVL